MNHILIAVRALKEIQYTYSGAGQSHEDLCRVKSITENALKTIGVLDMSLAEFKQLESKLNKQPKVLLLP